MLRNIKFSFPILRSPTPSQKKAELALKQLPKMKYMTTLTIPNKKIQYFTFDSTVNFLFCNTEHEIYVLNSHTFFVHGIISLPCSISIKLFHFSEALNIFVIVTQQEIWIYSLLTGEPIFRIQPPTRDYCINANISLDGRYLASIYNDGYYVLYSISRNMLSDLLFEKICEDKYDHAIIDLCFSTGCELVALGFDNGKAIIRSTDPKTNYQWIVHAHSKDSDLSVQFNKHNSFQFITTGYKRGEVKFFNIAHYGMKPLKEKDSTPKKKKKKESNQPNKKEEIECYKCFCIKNHLRIVYHAFSSDATILYVASKRKLCAWRIDVESIINEIEFDDEEIDSFIQIIPHLVIPQVAFVIAKSSLWIWNCLTKDLKCIVVQDNGEPLFQWGEWFRTNTVMVQTNIGSINYYSCENLQWEKQNYVINDYSYQWSNDISRILGEYQLPQIYKSMALNEKRGLSFFYESQIELNLDSDSDSDSSSEFLNI